MSDNVFRIIDANRNRLGEGLRLLEEIARLLLNDANLTLQLKTLRHDLLREDVAFHVQLMRSRQADRDVGANLEVAGEPDSRDLSTVIVANAKRVQESLRTLEELAKLSGIAANLNAAEFQSARFTMYTIEQQLLTRLLRKDKIDRLKGLYVIIDVESLRGVAAAEAALQVIRGGASVIQIRDKKSTKRELISSARALREICSQQNVLFIVNDHLDVALEADADGLHVGQDDLPVKVARKWLPADKILGVSVETVEQAVAGSADGADHLGVGAIFPTASRAKTPVVGLDMVKQIKKAVHLPLIGIGGIDKNTAPEVIRAGAASVAVISAVLGAKSLELATREIVERLEVNNERVIR